MNAKCKRTLVAVAAGSVMVVGLQSAAQATDAVGFTAVQTVRGNFAGLMLKADKDQERSDKWDLQLKTQGDSDLYVVRNAVAVGGHSGWHTHPGPSLITVTIGAITAYDSSNPLCTPATYTAGQTFLDSGDHAHLLRNETGAAAETVAVQFVPEGSVRRTSVARPNHCPDI
jgi:quercetin dioxygenase-like cupin family protein